MVGRAKTFAICANFHKSSIGCHPENRPVTSRRVDCEKGNKLRKLEVLVPPTL